MARFRPAWLAPAAALLLLPALARAHGVDDADRAFLESSEGAQVLSFICLGAKHMVTGYDHLLFLVGVIFFLRNLREVALYVSLFAVGHSITLTGGVLTGTNVNPYLIDAIIGLSVVYKGLDNLGSLQRWLGFQPDTRAAVFLFGLMHGLGLATKLQEFQLSADGLVANILAFNVGVELGQFAALAGILAGMRLWRASPRFERHAAGANMALVVAGVALTVYQLHGYFQPPEPPPAPLVAKPVEAVPEPAAEYIFRTDSVELSLAPDEGVEVKADMRAGDQMLYSWKADGELFFEFHGDPKGAPSANFTSYEKATASSREGEFEATFDGKHGWYWKNRTAVPVVVRVEARGVYASLKRI